MLYYLLYPLHTTHSAFNVFRYITFRTLLAGLIALGVSLLAGPWVIRLLQAGRVGEHIRSDGPERHAAKAGTPTMGGVLILFSMVLATILAADLRNPYVWMVMAVTLGFGVIGFADDYRKLRGGSGSALSVRQKLGAQAVVALLAALCLYGYDAFQPTVVMPFFKNIQPNIGMAYIPFAALVLIAASNAVNLTDGLDGLAIGPAMIAAATYAIFAYVSGHVKIAEYLQIAYVPGSGELAIFCGALAASALGFLWYNAYPAQMFMGDVGSLALGAAIAMVALVTKQELVLLLVGGVFVAEALSVIFQVASYKLRRRRIFLMAPIHHHYELKGWPEPQIIVRFWIISIICALVGLTTLKLR